MNKILKAAVCVLNSKYIHSSLAPWCLVAGIDTWCGSQIETVVVEGTINENTEKIVPRILSAKPDAIGFCCYIWNIDAVKRLIRSVKQRLPRCIIVLGGPEVSFNAEEVLQSQHDVDFIIAGEGEKPFAQLLNAICEGGSTGDIPGLCFKQGDKIITSPPHLTREEPPSPYTQKYLDALDGRIAYLETSRGCPYSCAFCLSGRCGNVRYYDVERAKSELLLLANSGAKTVKLVDRTFNANPKRAAVLFGFIINHYGRDIPKGVCFHFEIAGDILDDAMIDLLRTAPVGAIQFEIGLQSFHTKTLDAINRKTNIQRLVRNIKRLVECGNMHIHIDLIAGLPYEDFDSFANSFNIAYSLHPHMLQLGFLKLLHGSPMRENPECFPCRFSQSPPYEVIDTPWITKEELARLHNVEDALDRLYNSGRFRRTLGYVLRQTNLTPFELFYNFGEHCTSKNINRISLDSYTGLVYDWFGELNCVDKAILRDTMSCDRIATNSSGRLPAVLDVKDDRLKAALKELKKTPQTCPKRGVKRGAAILYTANCLVYADYENKNPVMGEYRLHKLQPHILLDETASINDVHC